MVKVTRFRWTLVVLCVCSMTLITALFKYHIPVLESFHHVGNLAKLSASEPDSTIPMERRFTPSENERVFILGAVAKNSTPSAGWDNVAIYGQWYEQPLLNDSDLKCCFKYDDGSVAQFVLLDHMVRGYPTVLEKAPLVHWHVTCIMPEDRPVLVSLARYSSCDNTSVSYIQPFYAIEQADGYTVITTKLAYKTVPSPIVIGFLETTKLLGVNKVVTYVCKNLDPAIKKILRYYAHEGFLEYHTIEMADEERIPRKYDLLGQYRNDEWLVIRDALERNVGATFFGIFDMDEYLIPSGNRSIPTLLADLRKEYHQASNFFFKNVHFLTDTGNCALNSTRCLLYQRHIMTSPRRFNDIHRKMFLIPSRVETKTICNHEVTPLTGYHAVTCPVNETYVRHYGSCRRKFNQKICRRRETWVEDRTMVAWAERTILNNVKNVLAHFRH